jgi:hypothetical protein
MEKEKYPVTNITILKRFKVTVKFAVYIRKHA